MKHLLSMKDLSKKDIEVIFRTADRLKNKRRPLLKGKTLGMIFAKPSTRTRVSFEVAMTHLGGHAVYLNWNDLQLGRGETIDDTAKVLSRFVDGIMARLFAHINLLELAKASRVPIINGLTDYEHPCQALADLYTIKQKKHKLDGLKIAFLGDGTNNTFHSLLLGAEKLGMEAFVACPNKYRPRVRGNFKILDDPVKAVKDADVVYTDTWVSMGQEKDMGQRLRDLRDYQLNYKVLRYADKDAIVMHPLPAHRGQEITSQVMDGPQSIVFDQAENRLHVQKAILYLLLK